MLLLLYIIKILNLLGDFKGLILIRVIGIGLAIFSFIGCGIMFDEKRKHDKLDENLKSFALSRVEGDSKLSFTEDDFESVDKEEKSYFYKNTQEEITKGEESCEGGGEIFYAYKEKNNVLYFDIDAKDCIDDGIMSNYKLKLELRRKSEELFSFYYSFIENAIFEDIVTKKVSIVYKGAKLNIEELSERESKSIEIGKYRDFDGNTIDSKNLISITDSENRDGVEYKSEYSLSGEVIYNGRYYRVDEDYSAIKTPLVYYYEEENKIVVSGREKFYNKKREHVTIEVLGNTKIKVSVDKDNDGKTDVSEIIKK